MLVFSIEENLGIVKIPLSEKGTLPSFLTQTESFFYSLIHLLRIGGRQIARDHAADIEWCPRARFHVLAVELPQPDPMVPAVIGMSVEIEKRRFGGARPDRLQPDPIEACVDVDIGLV